MNNYYDDRINNHKRFYHRRKELRNNPTAEELLVWNYLKNSQLGYKFRRQHSIGGYIVDFYCPEKKIAIELDGNHHDSQQDYDRNRDDFLKSFGIYVLRFKNNQIVDNSNSVLETILKHLNST